jgi:plastocyanin
MRRPPLILLILAVCLGALAAPAGATTTGEGVQRVKYRFGPIHVTPGQNTIDFAANSQRPQVPGYITRFKPDLEYENGKIPRVDVIHLHHGVWLVNGQPTFAAGEEKTIVDLPQGFGFRSTPQQNWVMNYMVHNLTPTPDTVYITYEIDFVPDTAPAAAGMRTVRTQWMDVSGPSAYPVFDALRAKGTGGRFTFPDDEPTSPSARFQKSWTVRRAANLVQTAGHLHPGGLATYLDLQRGGRAVRLFTSTAKYYEPAGATSWDVSMTATPRNWRIAVLPGDVVTVHGVYDVSKASWYESMAIMPVAVEDGGSDGADPFSASFPTTGDVTHGHLPENDHHGGDAIGLPDPRKLLDAPVSSSRVMIDGFVYSQGDLNNTGRRMQPVAVTAGRRLTFVNLEGGLDEKIYHTITACRAPCDKGAGIAYPLADGPVDFDSGELGFGPAGSTAAANRASWQTPAGLRPGTYTYFCRIHPFMRGAFRVKAAKRRQAA